MKRIAHGISKDDYSVSISNTQISAFERMIFPVTINSAANAKGELM